MSIVTVALDDRSAKAKTASAGYCEFRGRSPSGHTAALGYSRYQKTSWSVWRWKNIDQLSLEAKQIEDWVFVRTDTAGAVAAPDLNQPM